MMNQAKVERISYLFIFFTLVAVFWFKVATPLLTVLFSTLVLHLLRVFKRQWISIFLFVLIIGAILYGFVKFGNEAVGAIPEVLDKSIPIILETAQKHEVPLPFSDAQGLRALIVGGVQSELAGVFKVAEVATKQFVLLLISFVVAISLFLNSKLDLDDGNHQIKNNLYSALTKAISERFRLLYKSFETVMGAQLIISLINTVFTGLFVIFLLDIPYAKTVTLVTFLCGLLPIIGNIISNSVIFCIALTVSSYKAMLALGFLIILHKFEYFLNSKIIGHRIKNPMWLTLLGLMAGETLMGIPGMILAPVLLHYIKTECASISVQNN